MADGPDDRTGPPPESSEPPRRGFAAWWARHRDRVSILAIGGIALGGIVCMFLTVLILVFG